MQESLISDPPKCLVVNSTEGDHAGFILLSCESTDHNSSSGQCVTMLTTVSTEGLESKMGIVISELKVQGEHNWKIYRDSGGISLSISPAGFPEIKVAFGDGDTGDVFTDFDSPNELIGSAFPAKKNEE